MELVFVSSSKVEIDFFIWTAIGKSGVGRKGGGGRGAPPPPNRPHTPSPPPQGGGGTKPSLGSVESHYRLPSWKTVATKCELGTWGIFWIFSLIKNYFFALFIKLFGLGVGFLNSTGAEMGCQLDKKAKQSFFIIKKIKKYRTCPAVYRIVDLIRPLRPDCKNAFFP